MNLHGSKWLATKLGLSISTIERLWACESDDIPKAIIINRTIRYCEHYIVNGGYRKDWHPIRQIIPSGIRSYMAVQMVENLVRLKKLKLFHCRE